jgi:hypothetical protein
MSLAKFLSTFQGQTAPSPVTAQVAAWTAAVAALVGRFRVVLGPYKQLELHGWNVLREHRGLRYNAEALTIEFGQSVITLEPEVLEPEPGVLGRATLNAGVRLVHLDCDVDGTLWRYKWVIPSDKARAELDDAAIESLVEQLLAT